MKKQLLYSTMFTFLGISTGLAQITLTQSDMPQVGTAAITASDTSYNGTAGTIGTGQTWNFSTLLNHRTDAYFFAAANTQPGFSNFSGSNICMPSPPADSMWTFMTSTASGFFMNGLYNTGSSFPAPVFKYNPPMQLIKLPCTYNTTFTNTAKGSLKIAVASPPIDSMEFRTSINQSSIMDAWGTLVTPAGSFSTLRQKRTDISTDSTFYKAFGSWIFDSESIDTTINYTWWANNKHYPILEMSDDGAGVKGSVNYLLSSAVGLTEISKRESSIITFPNPAQNEMNFILPDGTATLQVMDIAGKVIGSHEVKGGEFKIDVSGLQNGCYSFTYSSHDGINNLRGKLIVSH
ncbi:MAG: T9SS type A sorting domain-containing protein [Bacteroidota bacterium]|nr:T9SS type A sorting domain-containing protein [Bacteroidota bacterium]